MKEERRGLKSYKIINWGPNWNVFKVEEPCMQFTKDIIERKYNIQVPKWRKSKLKELTCNFPEDWIEKMAKEECQMYVVQVSAHAWRRCCTNGQWPKCTTMCMRRGIPVHGHQFSFQKKCWNRFHLIYKFRDLNGKLLGLF